ncbi:MAG: hypothetical protein OXH63_21860 [Gemmatimonadetes bacterium]|nr:hypothetical protein [Gemmatimonadota bacterium]
MFDPTSRLRFFVRWALGAAAGIFIILLNGGPNREKIDRLEARERYIMDKNKGIVFGVFVGVVLCVCFFFALESHVGAVLLLAAVAIFAVTKGADYFKLKTTGSEDKGMASDELRERLAAVERRLTEVQDVMIALSEKIDHIGDRI